MKILALDSSGLVASVALVEDDVTVAEYTTNFKLTHSQTLLPMLEELRERISLDLDTIDAIAVAMGPGSFTGLRIGAATAKGLGLALKKPLIGVPSVDGLAYNLFGCENLICPIMDARRNQVYTGFYRFREGEFIVEKEQVAQGIEETLDWLENHQEPVVFLGDGVPVHIDRIKERLGKQAIFAPASHNRQRSASIGSLGAIYYKQGKTISANDFQPEYLRKSQAEREREERLRNEQSN